MNVLVIPEDFRKDQFILEPIIAAMMRSLGRSRATVVVCRDPLLQGVEEALKWERIKEILERYKGMVDLFLLCIDRDGLEDRAKRVGRLEELSAGILGTDRQFFGENAWQELEVWVLAGHRLPRAWSWRAVRHEINPKETYFAPFARRYRLQDEPDGGRKALAIQAARRYDRIRQLCPEDIAALADRIRSWLDGRA